MEAKLQELTKKIYKEGVEKAKVEADDILKSANEKSEQIITDAQKEAENIIDKAKRETSQLKDKVLSELELAGNQSITSLKQKITNLLSTNSLNEDIKKVTSDNNFIKDIIKEIVNKWTSDSKKMDINLILPEKNKDELIKFYKGKSKEILDKGVELKFENRMDGGFKIGPKDGSFILSFTDKDFENFFASFLKPKTKEILFK